MCSRNPKYSSTSSCAAVNDQNSHPNPLNEEWVNSKKSCNKQVNSREEQLILMGHGKLVFTCIK
jgi:hypothetical protein